MCLLKKLGEKIAIYRKRQKLSQEMLAELSGLHKNCIGSIERAEKNASIQTVYKIAKALNMTLSELLDDI